MLEIKKNFLLNRGPRGLQEYATRWKIDADTGDMSSTILADRIECYAVCWRRDLVATGNNDTSVRLWSLTTGETLRTLLGHEFFVDSIAFSRSEKLLASASNNTIRIWEVDSGSEVRRFVHPDGPEGPGSIYSLCFLRDDRLIAAADALQQIRVWDIGSGKNVLSFPSHSCHTPVHAMVFDEDTNQLISAHDAAYEVVDNQLACISGDETIRLWNADTGERRGTLRGHRGELGNGVFSLDLHRGKRLLASGGKDHRLMLWDVDSHVRLHEMTGHTDTVVSVSISPAGDLVASCSAMGAAINGVPNGFLKLWETDSGKEIWSEQGKPSVIMIEFSADGKLLFVGYEDGEVQLRNV